MENVEKIYLSQETLKKYKDEYEYLINVERPEVQAALKEARAQGDLSENAEYDAARERQGIVEGRISELEKIIDNAVIIENAESAYVGIGCEVTFTIVEGEDSGQSKTVIIMGSHDSNPFEGKISNVSPLASAMMGHQVGDVLEVEAPIKYTIRIDSFKQN